MTFDLMLRRKKYNNKNVVVVWFECCNITVNKVNIQLLIKACGSLCLCDFFHEYLTSKTQRKRDNSKKLFLYFSLAIILLNRV